MPKYWRLASSAIESEWSVDDLSLRNPNSLLQRISVGDRVVLSRWDDAAGLGYVEALGIVTSISSNRDSAVVDWRESDEILRPNPTGKTHWRSKPFFGFAKSVVDRYLLETLFAERFPDLAELELSHNPPTNRNRRLPTTPQPGYVYVISSEHGFKIGKTKNLRSRTRLFEVKLPFPIEVEHYAHFDDYSRAEQMFHDMFAEKRLEGEWFDLTDTDLEEIKRYGDAVPVEGL